ncbi:MAG: exodeoxyribonuclease VII large subunit, partial [Saprospiraceae bacterium]|nr:exodeoxyribonuclease VII large subunit [Saprospiraceae bacterium]
MKKYTLFELQQYLHRVISLNFPEPVWVTAEVSQVKSSRGHLYLDLVQKKEGDQGQ